MYIRISMSPHCRGGCRTMLVCWCHCVCYDGIARLDHALTASTPQHSPINLDCSPPLTVDTWILKRNVIFWNQISFTIWDIWDIDLNYIYLAIRLLTGPVLASCLVWYSHSLSENAQLWVKEQIMEISCVQFRKRWCGEKVLAIH